MGVADECVRAEFNGQCLAPGFCAFSDSSCTDTGLRWDSTAADGLAETCVELGGGGQNACGGTAVLAALPGQACGVCDSGSFACDGTEALSCDGEATLEVSATDDGATTASTEFSGSFPAGLATDDMLATSWFSSGPATEPSGESTYTWTADDPECISRVTAIGNGDHTNVTFQTMFGFAQVVVEVYDGPIDSTNLVFSQSVNLPGTPDPDAVVQPNVRGTSVRLVFSGHESSDCGGFSELIINALRSPDS